jgi:hypothetical protein
MEEASPVLSGRGLYYVGIIIDLASMSNMYGGINIAFGTSVELNGCFKPET